MTLPGFLETVQTVYVHFIVDIVPSSLCAFSDETATVWGFFCGSDVPQSIILHLFYTQLHRNRFKQHVHALNLQLSGYKRTSKLIERLI